MLVKRYGMSEKIARVENWNKLGEDARRTQAMPATSPGFPPT